MITFQLFDFDVEVQPILEVLIGKTTEQALAEVAQEEELMTLREQQRRYVELRDAERAERHRLAAQDDRLHREKVPTYSIRLPCHASGALPSNGTSDERPVIFIAEVSEGLGLAPVPGWLQERRVAEARVAQQSALQARERAAAAALVQGYVAELLPAVLAGLRDQGFLLQRTMRGTRAELRRHRHRRSLIDRTMRLCCVMFLALSFVVTIYIDKTGFAGVDEEFMPWLVAEVSAEIESIITSRDVITGKRDRAPCALSADAV